MTEIVRLDAAQAQKILPSLVELLQDAVESGASIGFWSPLSQEEALAYWQKVIADLPEGYRILLVALENDSVLGSIQLELSPKQNGSHRAEVQKLMVHQAARRRGLGQTLLNAIEEEARQAGRSILVLDTRRGDEAERLYAKHGYIQSGIIPRYVLEADGSFSDTVVFYRWL